LHPLTTNPINSYKHFSMNDENDFPASIRHFKTENVKNNLENHLITHHPNFVLDLASSDSSRQAILEEICLHGVVDEWDQGDPIFFQGDVAHEWFLVLDGSVSIHVYTTADSNAFYQNEDKPSRLKIPSLPKTNGDHKFDRHDESKIRKRHCQGDVLKLGEDGVHIENLPLNAKYKHYYSKTERKRLGKIVASMEIGSSFGQVGLLNKSPRSGTSLSENCLLLCLDKNVYDRTIRNVHIDTPQSIDKKIQLLRYHYIFQNWPMRQLEKLAFGTDLLNIKHKDYVYDVGDRANYIFIVMSGLVHCTLLVPKIFMKQNKNGMKTTTNKVELEKCGPLTLLGLEFVNSSVVNGIMGNDSNNKEQNETLFPCYDASCPAVWDTKVLRISVNTICSIIKELLEKRNNEKSKKESPNKYHEKKEKGKKAVFDTIPALFEYHQRRLAWWDLRKQFHKVYFDVSVVMTMGSQSVHYHQVCGRCGQFGHSATNTLKCKLAATVSFEKMNEVLNRVTGIEHIINFEVENFTPDGPLLPIFDNDAASPTIEDTDGTEKEMQLKVDYNRKQEFEYCQILLKEAALRISKKNHASPIKPLTTRSTHYSGNSSPPPSSLQILRNNRRKRRTPVWDTLQKNNAVKAVSAEIIKDIQRVEEEDEDEDEDDGEHQVTSELRAVLNMRNRTSKAPLNSMLVNAYPNLKKNHKKMHAGQPKCANCRDRGHHMYSCPFNPTPASERRRDQKKL
jgi:CRP-like cAMP-binding protein